jgi:hypothetical protein
MAPPPLNRIGVRARAPHSGLIPPQEVRRPGIGLVPSELERACLEADFTRIARQMLIILDRHGVAEHVQREIVDMAEGACPRNRRQPTARLRTRHQLQAMTLSSQWMQPLRSPVVSAPRSPATSPTPAALRLRGPSTGPGNPPAGQPGPVEA